MRKFLYITLPWMALLFPCTLFAQSWMRDIPAARPTLPEIKAAFYNYWKDKPVEKGKGYSLFKRWEWYWETRVLENGEFPSPTVTRDAWEAYRQSHPEAFAKQSGAANWAFQGPSTTPGGYNGLGRLNCMAFHPTLPNTFWVGAPDGGLWKTTNGGSTWTTTTDALPVLGVSDIAVHPTSPQILYIATGDGDQGSLSSLTGSPEGDSKSIGVLKSTNGGSSWTATGLNWSVTAAKLIRRLLINPDNPQILIAAASDGIWRTTDGGATWANEQSGYFMDAEFKPGDPSIVYASTFSLWGGTEIYRSTNSGSGWSSVAYMANVSRSNLAVTPAWPDLVDAVCADLDGGLWGMIYSSNSGASFSQYFFGNTSNNLLNISELASGSGGQGTYDLAYAINPNDYNDIWLGGINTWNSTNGGANYYLKTIWSAGVTTAVPEVHADKHFFAFHPLQPGTLFECNDGGLYKTTNAGATWTDLSNGLGISQIYRIGAAQNVPNTVICGLQDNGTRERYNNQWFEPTGGDGMECIIDYTDPDIQYASYLSGKIFRTYDGWSSKTTISDNIPGQPSGAWVTPYVIHPTNPQVLYAGYQALYQTTDRGNSWFPISPVLSTDNLRALAVAPSNPDRIYAASYDAFFLTTDGGFNWNYFNLTIPGTKFTYIAVHPTVSQTVWVTLSGYAAGEKVYQSTDGGANWTNISGTLPNLPVNCITYQEGSNGGLYVGTDAGVFYTDNTLSDWVPYQSGLPNVVVTELEIAYNNNKLWAATFGRGLWNSDLYNHVVGAPEAVGDPAFTLAPNPSAGRFTVIPPSGNGKGYDVQVYNVQGREVYNAAQLHGVQEIALEAEAGVYFVHVRTGNATVVKKVVIAR